MEQEAQQTVIIDRMKGPAVVGAVVALVGSMVGVRATRTQGRLEWIGIFLTTLGSLFAGGLVLSLAADAIDRVLREKTS